MAANRKGNAKTIEVTSSAALTSGAAVVQSGWFGIALESCSASGVVVELAIEGRWNIPVPASTVKGDQLYIPGAKGVLTTSTGPTFTRTSANTNSPVCKAMTDRDAAGNADVMIVPPAASNAALQV